MSDITFTAGSHAFGDGNHPSTRGVLEAFMMIDPDAFTPTIACDMGAGAGLLSFAMATRFGCPVIAVERDRAAVEVLRENVARNGMGAHPLLLRGRVGEGPFEARAIPPDGPHLTSPLGGEGHLPRGGGDTQNQAVITPIHADGFHHPEITARAPYDLLVMNILPEPLLKLAVAAHSHLASGGVLILSGIMIAKESIIIQAYQALELELTSRIVIGDWVTLVWQKP